jgi:hypothetical protein
MILESAIDIEVFRAFYGQSVRQSEFGKVLSKSSLSIYNNCPNARVYGTL